MARTVFWSWQSDQAPRETRHLIREALWVALERISVEMEEADRPEIDHDTKGAPGSPDIVATILSKIEQSAVFVADVTPIAISEAGKQVANPNVLIELGFAKHALGTERIVMVWNTALTNARPEDLPFDMRHRRAPISYALAPGATKDELRKARAYLADCLEERLRGSFEAIPTPPAAPLPWQPASANDPSIWNGGENPLAINLGYDGSIRLGFGGRPRAYARILPSVWERKADALKLLNGTTGHPVPLGRYSGLDFGPTQGGFIAFRSSGSVRENGISPTATRWFKENGELWGVATSFFNDGPNETVLATQYAIERWIGWIQANGLLCQRLGGKGPFHIKLGLEGLESTVWPPPLRGGMTGPEAIEPRIELTAVMPEISEEGAISAVKACFDQVLEAYGHPPFSDAEFGAYRSR